MQEKIELKDSKNGFSERDLHSKAILNTDSDMLLKYKIQRNRHITMNASVAEIEKIKNEFQTLKNELCDIKQLLLQIAGNKTCQ